jgi:MFS family permease
MYFTPPAILTIVLTKLPVLGVVPVVGAILMLAGAGWALININSLPMVVDMTTEARIGTYTGLYYLFSTLSAIVGPNMNGWIVQLSNLNYNAIMIVSPVLMLVALILMLGVRRGEAKTENAVG